MRKALLAATAATLVLGSGIPASAATADGCTLGSPNIIRDVTDCVQHVLDNCSLGSPNIITDLKECLR